MANKIRLATNIQLMEWLAKGKGLMKIDPRAANPKCMTSIVESVYYEEGRHFCYESDLNKPVSNKIRIRRWGDPHWRLPVVNYINKDLKEQPKETIMNKPKSTKKVITPDMGVEKELIKFGAKALAEAIIRRRRNGSNS